MKKPTQKYRTWHEIHARKLERRRNRSKQENERRGQAPQTKIKVGSVTRRAGVAIACPEDFSLGSNFLGVMQVLRQIRRQSTRRRNERTYIDFRPIRNLSPDAALILAAELYRWSHVPPRRRLRAVDVNEWNPEIRQLLDEMGFFQLLETSGYVPNTGNSAYAPRRQFVKFRTGTTADGEAIHRLRQDDLDPVVGELPRKAYLYAAVTEAMTNVVHHAYRASEPTRNWWLSAWHDQAAGEVAVMMFDQGIGIPKSLPRRFMEVISVLGDPDHAKLIRTAHDLSRTASGEEHRGHGLGRDVRGYLERIDCEGHYRVVSLEGEYVFERRLDGSQEHRLHRHPRPLNGTLIEWRLKP